jgi:hypothetical protein
MGNLKNFFRRKIIIDYGAMKNGNPVGFGNTGFTTEPIYDKQLTQNISVNHIHVWSVNGTCVVQVEDSEKKGNYIRVDVRNY